MKSNEFLTQFSRRSFLGRSALGLGAIALSSLTAQGQSVGASARESAGGAALNPMAPRAPHFAPRASRVIYMHMVGAPSQLEMFDYKPVLTKFDGKPCPESFLAGKQFAFITGKPNMLGAIANFQQRGQSGAYVSDHLPFFAKVADDVTFLKAVHTDEFNHAPAQLMAMNGHNRTGRPGVGSWVAYGLGTENQNMPAYVVLMSNSSTHIDSGKAAYGSGFLPSIYQGVKLRSKGEPVLYLSNPDDMNPALRRRTIEAINRINREEFAANGDPEVLTRIGQYELAFRMQASVPEAMDIWKEPESMHRLYGTTRGKATFANNCLLARRLIERGVRFVQLFDDKWDAHGDVPERSLRSGLLSKCKDIDQGMAALVQDLKQRGLLEDTLVVWGSEFGRTPMQEVQPGRALDPMLVGRDHHRDAFTVWMAGAGLKPGFTHGETDDFGYNGVTGKVHVHDVQATILHLLGFDHERLTFPFQGRNYRLTDVAGNVIKPILA